MKLAVLSGKGGTGKTLVSVNLAAVAKNSVYVDCDVEEPNGHLFFKPVEIKKEKVSIKIPVVDEDLCLGCRKCVDFCKFNALAAIINKLIVFDDICHSCGGCIMLCPSHALTEKDKVIGKINSGISEEVKVISGILNTGEASGIPIIKELLNKIAAEEKMTLIDCPPGSACIVMESIRDVDYCILVAEPTVFGLHNLALVYQLVKLFNKPHGVVINKWMAGENLIEQFCNDNQITVLSKIPFESELGAINSDGEIAAKSEKYYGLFSELLKTVVKEVEHETVTHS
ncbi:Electron transport complex subunit RsxB [Acetobacterium wieringae]|uniref:nucleotide-binding protein n=1 Tax=Acetobacterium wieringae TaxID=52694 RepID=UPI001D635047|nr:ATP-binding protein [Acetobacterium wieringae]VUZ25842.1 Electron transport complex subunit RsxB [Acetobacterium wieringae]